MRISSKSDYALKALLYLALDKKGGVVRLSEIARVERIPIKFLEQVVLALKSKGLVESKRGASGGYRLAGDPAKISLRDVLEATEDTVLSPTRDAGHSDLGENVFTQVWEELNAEFDKRLRGIKLKSMVDKAAVLQDSRKLDFAI